MRPFGSPSAVLSFLAAVVLAVPAAAQSLDPRLLRQGEGQVKAPLVFEENGGQVSPRVAFSARGRNFEIFLTRDGEAWLLGAPAEAGGAGRSLRLRLAGGQEPAAVAGLEPGIGKVSYFRGNDPARWQKNLSTYRRVRYSEVYPGIDWIFRPAEGKLEYDFVLAPGADPGAIALLFDDPLHPGAKVGRRIAEDGSLVVEIAGEEVHFAPPELFQVGKGGEREKVAGRYRLAGERVGFTVGKYDRRRELVIDPVLLHASYLGGSQEEFTTQIRFDPDGNIYLATMTFSNDFPTLNALQPTAGGSADAVVTKLNPAATEILFSTYIGGLRAEFYPALEALADGVLLFLGIAGSTDLPMVNSWDPTGDTADVALFKLAPDGSEILFSTYFGGSSYDIASGHLGATGAANVSVDALGRIFFAGLSYSDDLPVTPNALQPTRSPGVCGSLLCPDSFLAVFSADGQTLVYSTYYGADGDEVWPLLATAAPDGDAILYGLREPLVGLLPTRNAYQPMPNGGVDLYIARLPIDGSPPRFATYFGGPYNDGGGVALDGEGRIGVAGIAGCLDFPLLFSEHPLCPPPGSGDAFAARLNARGTGLDFSSLYPGSAHDGFSGLRIDAAGNFVMTGLTTSTDFAWVDPVFPPGGGTNATLAYLHTTGPRMLFATPYGGSGIEYGHWSAVRHADDSLWVMGQSDSTDLPLTPEAVQPELAGGYDAYFAAFQTRKAVLATPSRLPVTSGGEVLVPVTLSAGGLDLAALSFVLPIPECFEFDPGDLDLDGAPDDLLFDVPGDFSHFVTWNAMDNELGVVLYDASLPFARLATGTLLRVRLTALCQPAAGYQDIELPFSEDPAPTFGLATGYDAPGSALTGSLRLFGGLRGDCNGNGVVTSADLPACVLEIFDTDGDFWLDAIHSTFPGSPYGCDSNGDGIIDAGDLACTARRVLAQPCDVPLEAGGDPVRLLLPARLEGLAGQPVLLPIELQTSGQAVRSVVFSLDLPPSLSFDPATGISGLPPGFTATATYLSSRTFGELQVAIAPGTGNLPAGQLLVLELATAASPAVASAAAIRFGVEPRASWGGSRGESLAGEALGRTALTLAPPAAVFYDGFETGDASRWSTVAPAP